MLFLGALAVAAFGVTSSQASFMMMALVVALFIGSPVAGRLLDKLPEATEPPKGKWYCRECSAARGA